MTDLEYFSERLSELIFDEKEEIVPLSKKLQIGKSTLYNYLKGKNYPTVKNALCIADYFSCPLDYLFGLSHDFTPTVYEREQSIANRVKEAVDMSGKSRYALSSFTGIPQPKLSLWYHGEVEPNTEHLILLSKVLGVSLDFLVGRKT